MLLTIIIPHYNLPQELLERCLECVKTQGLTSTELEVILIDDGSENPPLWVNERFPEVQLICAKHGGLGSARNIGMGKATGEYLLFLDSDDFLEPKSLKKCLDILKNAHPDILRFRWRKTNGQKGGGQAPQTMYPSSATYMAQNNLSAMACIYLFRSDLIKKHHIAFQTGVYHEDEEFTTRLHYHAGPLIDTDILVYNYYIRPDSITQDIDVKKKAKRFTDLLCMLQRIKSFSDEVYPTASPIQRQGIDRKLTFLTVDSILNTITLGRSWAELHKLCHTTLSDLGLYPLPRRDYSFKYTLFRLFSNCDLGLRILYTVLKKRV